MSPAEGRAAGWYLDPFEQARLRWWDGERWTDDVQDPLEDERPRTARRGRAVHPAGGQVVPLRPRPPSPPRTSPGLESGAVRYAVGGLVLAAAAGITASWLAWLAGLPDPVAMLVSFAALWAPMVAALVLASRRYGSGDVRADLGARFVPIDWLGGLLVAAGAFQAAVLVEAFLAPFGDALAGSNTGWIPGEREDAAMVVAILLTGCVGAPIVEELFFRGLLQSALLSRFRPVPAVAIQSLAFGVVHVQPDQGTGNVGLVLSIAAIGAVLGTARHLTKRLGPSVTGHAYVNALVMLPLLVL